MRETTGLRLVDDLGSPTEPPARAEFDGFFLEQYSGTVRLVHLLTGSDAVSEDLAQEAFSRIEGRFDTLDNPAGYLRTVTMNLCRNWHRSRSREDHRLQLLRPETSSPLGADEILDVVDRLPERQRAVLVLRYWLDLSERDIASALGCRPGTVKSLTSRALRTLRKEIN